MIGQIIIFGVIVLILVAIHMFGKSLDMVENYENESPKDRVSNYKPK